MDFPSWALWLVAAVVAAWLELKLSNFVLIWVAAGAILGGLLAWIGASTLLQALACGACSALLFTLSRTVWRARLLERAAGLKMGAEALVGAEAVVTEELKAGGGAVRIHGELWSARSLEGDLPVGERVQIDRIEGLKLLVRRAQHSLLTVHRKAE